MIRVILSPPALAHVAPSPRNAFAKPDRSAHHKAGGGQVLQPPPAASIRDGSAAQSLAGSRGVAPSPTGCLQPNSRSVLRFSGNGG